MSLEPGEAERAVWEAGAGRGGQSGQRDGEFGMDGGASALVAVGSVC